MKKTFAILAFSMAVCPAFADANDTSEVLKGGRSLIIEYPDGKTVTVMLKPDGTYTRTGGKGGRWTISGEHLCTYRKLGKDDTETESCGYLPSGKQSGASWETKDGAGSSVTARID